MFRKDKKMTEDIINENYNLESFIEEREKIELTQKSNELLKTIECEIDKSGLPTENKYISSFFEKRDKK